MSDATTSPQRGHAADPWWGEGAGGGDHPVDAALPAEFVASAAPRPVRRRRARRRTPLLLRLLALPGVLTARALRRSPWLRRMALRLVVLAVVVGVVGGSIGVILLNNVVIRRTAELGELDQERRELRRENAVLGAQAANRSSQTQVVRRAEQQLGMVRSGVAPKYTYLDPASVALTPVARAQRARAAAARATAAKQAAGPAAPTTKEAPR